MDTQPIVTEDAFIRGTSFTYKGFDGRNYTATYRRDSGVRYVQIVDAQTGAKCTNPLMSETQARSFFMNVSEVA